jgi:hypothetical protein
MRINKSLNIVIPVDYEKGGQIFVHSTPISREIFEQYFLVVSKTFANIFSQGLGAISGPRVAYLMLKQTATEMGIWNGETGVQAGLVNEIIRLSNVLIPDKKGWKQLPLHTAVTKGFIDSETLAEIEGELVFFTCVSLMNKKNQVEGIMETVSGLWGSQTTSLGFTEFLNSLTTSTEEGNTGEMEKTSSVPA